MNKRSTTIFKSLFSINIRYFLITLSLIILCVIFSLILLPKSLSKEFESNSIYIHVEVPSGSSIDFIDNKLVLISKDLHLINGVQKVESHAKKKNGSISVVFNSKIIKRDLLIYEIKKLKDNYKDTSLFLPSKNNSASVRISFTGPNIKAIKDNIQKFITEIDDQEIVEAVVYNFKDGEIIYTFKPDRKLCSVYGVTPLDILKSLNWALSGPVTIKWQTKEENEKDLRIFLKEDDFNSIDEILEMKILTPNGKVPIGSIGKIDSSELNNTLYRNNLQKSLSITINFKTKKIDSIFILIENSLNKINLPIGYSYSVDKKLLESKKETRLLLLFIAVALFLIYSTLVISQGSFFTPVVILLTIPLSLFFTMLTVIIAAIPLTIEIFVGIIIVMGIIVNNGILIIENYNNPNIKDLCIQDKIVHSVEKRITSIFVTTGSTCIGYIPIIIGLGNIGDNIRNLAIVIFTGTLGSFFVGIYIFPTILYHYYKLRSKYGK